MSLPLDQTRSFSTLQELATQPPTPLDETSINNYVIQNGPLTYLYGPSLIGPSHLKAFQQLADEQQVIARYQALLDGDPVNCHESRAVTHHQTRHPSNRGFYGQQQERFNGFAEQVRRGDIVSRSGKPFSHIVQVGIGGSELGPKALYEGLRGCASVSEPQIKASFLGNIDPMAAHHVLSSLPLDETLFIFVSKSGSTQETLGNYDYIVETLTTSYGWAKDECRHQFISVTCEGSLLDDDAKFAERFYFDATIGGRFSSTSAVGGALISLCFGPSLFDAILEGANQMDDAALNPSIDQNISLLGALIGVWNRSFRGYTAKGVIPYHTSLSHFVAHLQQLDCESNGKSVNLDGQTVTYPTSPVVFGDCGTNAQHSFFQNIHQGASIIPIEFIGFQAHGVDPHSTIADQNHQKLLANMVAQSIALAQGAPHSNLNQSFQGQRPSTLLLAPALTPTSLGALLAYYENLVMFQGFLWHINSFDQEGVQLGKVLTQKVLSNLDDSSLLSQLYKKVCP